MSIHVSDFRAKAKLKLAVLGLLLAASLSTIAVAAEQRLLAVVNDQPVTSLDIDQQLQINRVLGARQTDRKQALESIINQVVKIEEAKRQRMQPSEADIDARVGEIAKGLGTTMDGLEGKLGKQGITVGALRQYVSAQISFARLLRFKYKANVEATNSEVDRKMAEIKSDLDGRISKAMADPRMKPVKVASLLEVTFPIDATDTGADQLIQARAAEANQYIGRFKGCKAAKAAAAGIFNVQVGKQFDADMSRLPKQLSGVMQQKGPNSAFGPMRTNKGIQVIAYCGQRTITPPRPKAQLPSRQQVEQAVLSEKFDSVEQKYVAQMRKNAIIEYRNASNAQ